MSCVTASTYVGSERMETKLEGCVYVCTCESAHVCVPSVYVILYVAFKFYYEKYREIR